MAQSSIRRVTEFLKAVEQGDSTALLPEVSAGEFGELERVLNHLVGEYRRMRVGRMPSKKEEMIKKELQISRAIQKSLLPARFPSLEKYEFAAFYEPAQEIGGDFYDVIEIDPDHVGIVISDVSGKSVSAAMLATVVRDTLRSQAFLTLSPREMLERSGQLLLPSLLSGFFVTLFYAVLDLPSGRVTCASAGHPPALWYRASKNNGEWIHPKGIAVGVLRGAEAVLKLEEYESHLESGDYLFLYTDGVTDAVSGEGKRFGKDGILKVVQEIGSRGGVSFLETLKERWLYLNDKGFQEDDGTAIVLSCREGCH